MRTPTPCPPRNRRSPDPQGRVWDSRGRNSVTPPQAAMNRKMHPEKIFRESFIVRSVITIISGGMRAGTGWPGQTRSCMGRGTGRARAGASCLTCLRSTWRVWRPWRPRSTLGVGDTGGRGRLDTRRTHTTTASAPGCLHSPPPSRRRRASTTARPGVRVVSRVSSIEAALFQTQVPSARSDWPRPPRPRPRPRLVAHTPLPDRLGIRQLRPERWEFLNTKTLLLLT